MNPLRTRKAKLHRGFTLVELMIVVAIIGILASIAIPSFVQYIRRSKTSEALMNLRVIYDGAAAYYPDEYADRSGTPLPKQFPVSQPMTPNPVPAGVAEYTPDATWATPSWSALNFNISDPHRFSYEFSAAGTDSAAAFTARAWGDLDGDGVYSMYERLGTIDNGDVVVGAKGIYQFNALE